MYKKLSRKRSASDADQEAPATKMACLVQPQSNPTCPQNFNTDLTNLPEVPQVNAFERGYEVLLILDLFENEAGELFLYIQFKGLADPELVPLPVVYQYAPSIIPSFYREYQQSWVLRNPDQ